MKRGQEATLAWQTEKAQSCTIEPGVGAVDANGSVAVAPTETTTYTLRAEGSGDSATASVTVTVENSPPEAEAQSVTTNEDTPVAITLTATDVDGDSLIFEVTGQPANGILSGTPPDVIYTPNADYHSPDAFRFTASDATATSAAATVNITVTPNNDPPVARAGQDRKVFVGDPVTLDGSGSSDVDADPLKFTWTLIDAPEGSAAALSDNWAVQPVFTPDLAGDYVVELIVNDEEFDSPADQVVITASLRMVDVPDLVGKPQAEAEAALLASKLVVGAIATDYSETVAEGAVISQSPAAGTSVAEKSAVHLTISLGVKGQPPAVSFSAWPPSVEQGQSSTLNWSSLRAESAHIDCGIGAVAVDGSTVVSPEHTTTYTLTVSGPSGSATRSVTIRVLGGPEPQPEGFFGERYNDLIPQDATLDFYDERRFSLITGRVEDLTGEPVENVAISIFGHPEYGTVKTNSKVFLPFRPKAG